MLKYKGMLSNGRIPEKEIPNMKEYNNKSINRELLGQKKAEAQLLQDEFNDECSREFREKGSLSSVKLSEMSNELENYMLDIKTMEDRLREMDTSQQK